jgi:predicted metalloprotease with PDZ domain
MAAVLLAAHVYATPPLDLGAVDARTVRGWEHAARVTHRVMLPAPQTQMLKVEVTAGGVSADELDFTLPTWRPGRYIILDLAGALRNVHARDASGTALPLRKVDKTTWRVGATGVDSVTLSYDLYANELDARTRHVDDTHAFLSGSSVFMLVEGRRGEPQVVRVDGPDEWRARTGLDASPDSADTFVAPDYDSLIDAPLEIGTPSVHAFEADGRPHELVIWGAARFEAETVVDDLRAIAEAQHAFWGEVPYGRFVWLLHITSGAKGATEHLNSTIIQVERDALSPGKDYRKFLGLASHEFFHTWNVKRLRPAGISPYNLTGENYTDMLWLAEGTTSYYGNLLLTRAGLLTSKQYFEIITDTIEGYGKHPGRHVQSAAAASFDAWIKFTKPSADSANSTVSFYSVGALISLTLDMQLRSQSGNRVSLDDVLRDAYVQFPLGGPGITQDDLLVLIQQRSGLDFTDFFSRHVQGKVELPIEEALRIVGLETRREEADEASDDDGDDDDGDDDDARADLGLKLADRDALAAVTRVRSDGPAYAAGVQAEDLIVALDGRRLPAKALERRLRQYVPGETVTLTLLRRDMLREIRVTLGKLDHRKLEIVRTEAPFNFQRTAYESWLGQEWPETKNGDQTEEAD